MWTAERLRTRFPAYAMVSGIAILLMAAGCSALDSLSGLRQSTINWAEARGFVEMEFKAGAFDLTAFIRRPKLPVETLETLTIYIEGDGAAWPTPYHPPRDPTPLKPVSLVLAAADPAPAVAYLGRPCQYLEAHSLARCSSEYWVEKRYAPEVVEASDAAVTKLKALFGARHVRLVGYSGGGVIATLVAARRSDVEALITVAAPLAVAKWIQWHGASPLTGSLDPIDLDKPLPAGVHFAGKDDKTVPTAIVDHFVSVKDGRVIVIPDFDHECCWTRDWTMLLKRIRAKESK